MILEHLPGLQADAFLITHGLYRFPFFISAYPPSIAPPPLSIGVSRLGRA